MSCDIRRKKNLNKITCPLQIILADYTLQWCSNCGALIHHIHDDKPTDYSVEIPKFDPQFGDKYA